MRSGSLALVIFVIGSTISVAAQQNTAMAGPIAQSIAREAARFAAVQQGKPADSEWSRVRRLAPGTEIIVTLKGTPPARWYFVRADESELLVIERNTADLQVVERIGRDDIAEIRMAKIGSNVAGCALTGYLLGGFAGGFVGGYAGAAVSRNKDAGFMRGMVIGIPIGGIVMYGHCRNKEWFLPPEMIYRAP